MKLKFVNGYQKGETIQYNDKQRGYRSNNVEVVCFILLQQLLHENTLKYLPQSKKKHDAIKLLTQCKLDRIADIISQRMQGEMIYLNLARGTKIWQT